MRLSQLGDRDGLLNLSPLQRLDSSTQPGRCCQKIRSRVLLYPKEQAIHKGIHYQDEPIPRP
jgi:hypothetical protein